MATVVDQLKQFRYVTSSRGLPWPFIRSVNVSQLKTDSPDLQQLKNVVSAISDCRLDDTTLNGVSSGEALQLFLVAQLAVQFLIHSQNVMKLQLVEAQNKTTVNTIASHHVLSLEAKVESMRQKLEEAELEKQSMKQVIYQLEKGTIELHTRAQCLERDLEYERSRPQPVARDDHQRPDVASAGAAVADCRKCGKQRRQTDHHRGHHRYEDPQHAARHGRYRSDGLVDDDALSGTTVETDTSAAPPPAQRQRRSNSNRPPRDAPTSAVPQHFVDWPSFAMLMLQQQQKVISVAPQQVEQAQRAPLAAASCDQRDQQPASSPHTAANNNNSASEASTSAALQLAAAAAATVAQEKNVQELRGVTESIANALASQAASTRHVTDTLAKLDAKVTEQGFAMERGVQSVAEKFEVSLRQVREQISNTASREEVRLAVRDEVNKRHQELSSQQQQRDASLLLNLHDLQQQARGATPSSAAVTSTGAAAATAAVQAPSSSQPASRAGSPLMLPPLPLASMVQDPDGGVAAGQQLITPSSVQGFGPRVVSESHVTSDDDDDADDDDPYVPIAAQQACKHCQEKHANIERHQQTCTKRHVQCQFCKVTMTAGDSASHKCAAGSATNTSGGKPPPTPTTAAAAASNNNNNISGELTAQGQLGTGPANLSASRIVVDGSAMLSDVSVASSTMQRKASSKMLKDTQDELERLLAEEAADEAKRRNKGS